MGLEQRRACLFLAKCCICCSSMSPGPSGSKGELSLNMHTYMHTHKHCNSTSDNELAQAENDAFTDIYINRKSTDALVLFFLSRWSGLKSTLTHTHTHTHTYTHTSQELVSTRSLPTWHLISPKYL